MSHCDPISHGTANSASRRKKMSRECRDIAGEKINKGRRGGGKKRQTNVREDQVESDGRKGKEQQLDQHGGDGSAVS